MNGYQQGMNGYPQGNGGQPGPGQAPQKKPIGSGYALASMILGIFTAVFFRYIICLVTGVLAIVFSVMYLKGGSQTNRKMAIAGLVLGIAGIAVYVIFLVLAGAYLMNMVNSIFNGMGGYGFDQM